MSFSKKILFFMPSMGLALFLATYVYATTLYPGGTSFPGPQPTVFSWTQNFWCDLLDTYTYTNQFNPARPYALFAMIVVALSITGFWFVSTRLYQTTALNILIRAFGTLGITSILLIIFNGYHNIGIILAGIFSSIAYGISLIKLYNENHRYVFWFGIFTLIATCISYGFFFSGTFIELAPMTHKVNFLILFTWMVSVNYLAIHNESVR